MPKLSGEKKLSSEKKLSCEKKLTCEKTLSCEKKLSCEQKLSCEKKLTFASGAIWWSNLHQMQEVHVVAKFNPSHGVNFWVRCASGNVLDRFSVKDTNKVVVDKIADSPVKESVRKSCQLGFILIHLTNISYHALDLMFRCTALQE